MNNTPIKMPTISDIFCCPKCRGAFNEEPDAAGAWCASCGARYESQNGILNLNPEPTAEAAQEMEGHRLLAAQWPDSLPEDLRQYVDGEAGEDLLFLLPRLPHPDLAREPSLARMAENADDFFELLDWMRIRPGEVILELGAHIGWAAHHLAKRGAHVIATDISPQLAITDALVRRGIPLMRAYADMTRLPVRDGVINTFFSVATIHHTDDLPGLFSVCARALRTGGRCVFFAEPVAGRYDTDVKATFGAAEKELGIQEHIYTIDEYFDAARRSGLMPSVLPLKSVLRDNTRRCKLFRWGWRLLLWARIGYHPLFMRYLYRFMLRFYPRIPFPHLALILTKR